MKSDTPREDALFLAAAQLTGPERESFLKSVCQGNAALHERLEQRLTAQAPASNELATHGNGEVVATVIAETAPAEEAGLLIGRYKLLEKLGEGGFGTVWLAEQKEPVRRKVALKIIKLGMDTRQVVARFEAERQALAMMDHPNIARVLDAGTTEQGRPYFVMELVRGIPITQFCDEQQMPTKTRLELFIKVCQAIQHAHQKGIIHRDIKPSNVMVTLHDGVAVPKVIDFGIAKATQQELTDKTIHTQFQQFIGTPAYMSPEQAEMSGLDVDTRSDIYSLGVLLYELLMGKTPFDGKELMASGIDAMRKTIREKEPVRPSTRLATLQGEELTTTAKRRSADAAKLLHLLKGDLDWIAMKCLEKDRTRRYETANGLAADLKRHLDHEPVVARPPSRAYRLQKTFRRHRLVFTAGAVVLAALVAGITISTWQTMVARNAQRETEAARRGEQRQRLEAQAAQKFAEREEQRANAQAQKVAEGERRARRWLYAADMNLVHQAIKSSNLGRARELLYRNVPHEGAEDLRGWEWRYFWQFCQSDELFTFLRHTNSIFKLGFSPDGHRLVVSTLAGEVQVWDVVEGRRLFDVPTEHGRHAVAAFSPAGDVLAVADSSQQLVLWDTSLWKPLATLTNAGVVRALHFSPDGKHLLTSNRDGHLNLWDATAPFALRSKPMPRASIHHGEAVFTSDNRRIVVGDSRGRIQVLDAATLAELAEFHHPTEGIESLAVSPDGRFVATGSGYSSHLVHIWATDSGTLVKALEGHRGHVPMLAFSSDGRWLASASADQTVRLWDTRQWESVATYQGHNLEVWSLAFTPDGSRLFTGSKDGDIKVWDPAARPRSAAFQVFQGVSREWRNAGLTADGKEMVYLDASGQLIRLPLSPNGTPESIAGDWTGASAVVLSPRNRRLAVYDITSGRIHLGRLGERSPWTLLPSGERWQPLMFDGEGIKLVARQSETNTIAVFDLNTGRILHRWTSPGAGEIRAASWPGNPVAFLFRDHRVKFIDLMTGAVQAGFSAAEPGVMGLPDVSGLSLARSADSSLLAIGSEYGTTSLWDVSNGSLLGVLKGHLRGVHSVAFLPEGRRLLTFSGDEEALKIWDVTTRQELATLPGTGSLFIGAWVSTDSSTIASVNSKDVLHVWRAPSWEEIAAAETRDKGETRGQPDR